ncbi:MAG: alanine racemase [Candidatus Harrisonbacteria bacterium]|nr:alanine racemase [Candidatus Harrisonbacteria bacterium]
MAKNPELKTWVEISRSAAEQNLRAIGSLIPHQIKIWAVVKSNAYGHGLQTFSGLMENLDIEGFCVDSIFEAAKMRQHGVKKPILVIGPTLDHLSAQAAHGKVTLSVSTYQALEAIAAIEARTQQPEFHIKIDTGLYRQGFDLKELKKVFTFIRKNELKLRGIYSHFAAAKDPLFPSYSAAQFERFQKALTLAEAEGFSKLVKHIAASPGILMNADYALDRIRTGISLYGYYPSKAWAIHLPNLGLKPVLSWHARISEIKEVEKNTYIGYNLSYKTTKKTRLATIPVGYWHGLDPMLSNKGAMLIAGKRAPIRGLISMDFASVDVSDIHCDVGSVATIIGSQGKESIDAQDLSDQLSLSPHVILTRLNPRMKRVIVD